MAVDYVLFVGGLNERRAGFSHSLLEMVRRECPGRSIEGVEMPMGEVVDSSHQHLRRRLAASTAWDKMWFREFRDTSMLHAFSAAALFVSRRQAAGVGELWEGVLDRGLSGMALDDRLHVVSQGWGTILLLDLLLAPRWNGLAQSPVQSLRRRFLGTFADAWLGHPLRSMISLGAPLHFFSLLHPDFNGRVGDDPFDIVRSLRSFLSRLERVLCRPLAWVNVLHPADLVAAPVHALLHVLGPQAERLVQATDQVIPASPLDHFGTLVAGGLDLMPRDVNGGPVHGRYWSSHVVAEQVARTIIQASVPIETLSA